MARFMVERTFPDGLEIPQSDKGAQACLSVVGTNAELGVTWVHSYVTDDHTRGCTRLLLDVSVFGSW